MIPFYRITEINKRFRRAMDTENILTLEERNAAKIEFARNHYKDVRYMLDVIDKLEKQIFSFGHEPYTMDGIPLHPDLQNTDFLNEHP